MCRVVTATEARVTSAMARQHLPKGVQFEHVHPMPAHDPKTLDFYATEAPRYHARNVAPINCELPGFLARLAPGASILELGCGGGRDAAYMEAAGFVVDPTDGVLEMAALATVRLGRPIRVMRFDELDTIEAYDAVYASYSLLHVPRAALIDVLRRIHVALKPGGWHMATYKSGGQEGRDVYDRYFNYLAREEARDLYAAAGDWLALEFTEGEGEGYDGRVSPWVTVTGQRSPRLG